MNWGRISAGIVAMSFAAWTAGSSWSSELPYEPAIGLFVAFFAWLRLEFTSQSPLVNVVPKPVAPSPNDLRLGRRLREAFPAATRRFLREHAFGQVYHESKTKPLEDLAHEWRGAAFEFDDYHLRLAASAVITDVNDFLDKLAMHSGVAGNYPPGNFSIPTDEERATDYFSNLTDQRIAEATNTSEELLTNFEDFERDFRAKAPAEFA